MGDIVFSSESTIEVESIDAQELNRVGSFEIDTPSFDGMFQNFTISAEGIVDELEEESDEISFLEEGSFLVIPE
jgi:hypothetical protein